MCRATVLCLIWTLLLAAGPAAQAGEWSGSVSAQLRHFPFEPLDDRQFEHGQVSLAFESEYFRDWDGGRQQFVFSPFFRLDQRDDRRTHADIRELAWLKAAENWELRVGVRKVFWGVTEFLHLVDIINQTDLVESPDEEEKLGQPMLNFAVIRDWGTLDFFVLAGFRERTFPGREGRLRTLPYVDTDHAEYESSAEQSHVDFAVRWSHSVGDWDVGLAHFWGTSREPRLLPRFDAEGDVVLTPFYDIINQTSLDLQYTTDEWLWKLEWLTRDGQGDRYSAAIGGFEYTFVGLFDSVIDLGLIAEYAYDDRKDRAPTPFENDLMLGARLALNDAQSSELLAGAVFDLDSNARWYSLEASRRVGNSFTLSAEARFNDDIPPDELTHTLRNEDYLQLELSWFF